MPSSAGTDPNGISPRSLHDALPIWSLLRRRLGGRRTSVACPVRRTERWGRRLGRWGRRAERRVLRVWITGSRVLISALRCGEHPQQDRKSTRLNSSHVAISYAVFCWYRSQRDLSSFPTRRSSDLVTPPPAARWSADERRLPGAADRAMGAEARTMGAASRAPCAAGLDHRVAGPDQRAAVRRTSAARSEEHTSELQSRGHLVCRLLLVPIPTGSLLVPYTTLFRSGHSSAGGSVVGGRASLARCGGPSDGGGGSDDGGGEPSAVCCGFGSPGRGS